MQDSHSPATSGGREQTHSTQPPSTSNPRRTDRKPWSGLGILAVVTGGIVGIALAALKVRGRSQALTLDTVRRLEPGMSYEQVCETLGRRGEDISVAAGSKLFAWKAQDGSRLAALFRDGTLVYVGAAGLK